MRMPEDRLENLKKACDLYRNWRVSKSTSSQISFFCHCFENYIPIDAVKNLVEAELFKE